VAPRQIKTPGKDNSHKDAEEVFSQRKRPESGRYLLQVDKQTKGSYKTPEAAPPPPGQIRTEALRKNLFFSHADGIVRINSAVRGVHVGSLRG
jgi:hypothetical protein